MSTQCRSPEVPLTKIVDLQRISWHYRSSVTGDEEINKRKGTGCMEMYVSIDGLYGDSMDDLIGLVGP
jgi:hypothetical protein